jgi:hypothetical protein
MANELAFLSQTRTWDAFYGEPRIAEFRRRAEQREDAVAGRLHDVAVIALDRVDHVRSAGSIIARASSGLSSSISAVEPLISANNAVTVLRSPSSFSGAGESATRIAASLEFFEAAGGCPSAAAHSPQNSSLGSFVAPHWGHARAGGAAHFPQNLRPSRLSLPHLAQRIRAFPPSLQADARVSPEDASKKTDERIKRAKAVWSR